MFIQFAMFYILFTFRGSNVIAFFYARYIGNATFGTRYANYKINEKTHLNDFPYINVERGQ